MKRREINIQRTFTSPVVVIVAHPDDETIGVGAQLAQLRKASRGRFIIHVTDGAPQDLRDALVAGFTTREGYARARRRELLAALDLAGISAGQTREIGLVDREAVFNLVPLSLKLSELLAELRPSIALTHPYEGGHPDHDATAFAVHAACELLIERAIAPPAIVEMAFYHNREGDMITGEFLPEDVQQNAVCLWPRKTSLLGASERFCKELEVVLTEEQLDLKRRMMDCFASQRELLRLFPPGVEKFRRAPRYDFTRAPHAGDLLYERFGWGISGDEWRTRAREATYFISHLKYRI